MSVDQAVGTEPDAVAAARYGWAHVNSEVQYSGSAKGIMATFADVDVLTFVPVMGVEGRPKVLDTAALVGDFYEQTFAGMRLEGVTVRNQVAGQSYLFLDADFTATDRSSGQSLTIPNLILLPCIDGGVTGEIIFPHLGDAIGLQSPDVTTRADRLRWTLIHDELIAAVRTGDATAVARHLTAGFSFGVRTSGDATTFQAGHGETEGRLAQFFDTYEIADSSVVQFITGDWYVFSEIWWTIRDRGSPESVRRFSTAQFAPVVGADEHMMIYGVGLEW